MEQISKSWFNRAQQVLAQGHTGTNSKRPQNFPSCFPSRLSSAFRCYSWDEKAKRYIDFLAANGAYILGAAHPRVVESVIQQARSGNLYSLPSTLEIELAEKITNLIPEMEAVRFLKTGSEATMAANRIARTWTGEEQIYSEGYHGWHDEFISLTEPALGVSDFYAISEHRNDGAHIAIIEPIQTKLHESRKKEVQSLRKEMTCLIFDEIISGCRIPGYTVAHHWQIKPDLLCLGKAVANGFPLAVVGGRKEVMNCGEYFVSSTYSGGTGSLAACRATLNELSTSHNLEDLFYYANRFMSNFNNLVAPLGIRLEGYGTRFQYPITVRNGALLSQELCKAGILIGKAGFYHFGHMEEGIDEFVLNIVSDVVGKIQRDSVRLEGAMPTEVFRR